MRLVRLLILLSLFCSIGCSKGSQKCDADSATNKMLALGKVQARLAGRGGLDGLKASGAMAQEAAPVGELIASGKYNAACKLADELAKKWEVNLENEQKDMVSIEQLKKDGGRGTGNCSIADASMKQMEVHRLLQAEVDAGKRTSEVFVQFNKDAADFGELLATNPSKACALMDELKARYSLK